MSAPEPAGAPPVAHETGFARGETPFHARESARRGASEPAHGAEPLIWVGGRGGCAVAREAGSLDAIRAGSGESLPLSAKRARLPRAADFRTLARAAEAQLPADGG